MKKYFRLFGICFLIVAMLIFAKESGAAVVRGIALCGNAVIPALFPMLVGAKLLVGLLRELRLPKAFLWLWQHLFGLCGPCFYGFLFGLLGGYPLGAAVISELYERKCISKSDAEQSLLFCNNSGPGFFVAALGANILHSGRDGLLLYVSHAISALLIGLFLRRRDKTFTHNSYWTEESTPLGKLLIDSIRSSCTSILQICGLIIFFTVLGDLIQCIGVFHLLSCLPTGNTSEELRAILQGVLELTSGVFSLESSANSFVIAAFLIGWGGFCVHIQAAALWTKAGLQPKGYYSTKLIHGIISALIAMTIQHRSISLAGILVLFLLIILIILRNYRKYTGNPDRYAL